MNPDTGPEVGQRVLIQLPSDAYHLDRRTYDAFLSISRASALRLEGGEQVALFFRGLQKFLGAPHFFLYTPDDPPSEGGDALCHQAHVKSTQLYALATLPLIVASLLTPELVSSAGMLDAERLRSSLQRASPMNSSLLFLRSPQRMFEEVFVVCENLLRPHCPALSDARVTRELSAAKYRAWNFQSTDPLVFATAVGVLENPSGVLDFMRHVGDLISSEGFFLRRMPNGVL